MSEPVKIAKSVDDVWLRRMAEAEQEHTVSVGGLVGDISDAELAGYLSVALPELHQTHPEAIMNKIREFRSRNENS